MASRCDSMAMLRASVAPGAWVTPAGTLAPAAAPHAWPSHQRVSPLGSGYHPGGALLLAAEDVGSVTARWYLSRSAVPECVLHDPRVHGDARRHAGVDRAGRPELADRRDQRRRLAGRLGESRSLLTEQQHAGARKLDGLERDRA